MINDLTEDALVASCPGDVGLVSWVHYKMEQRIQELEHQLKTTKFIRCSERLPELGQKVIIYSAGVIQEETYELDQAVDGFRVGEYFWNRDDLDECPPVDFEDDQWIYCFYLIALVEKGSG